MDAYDVSVIAYSADLINFVSCLLFGNDTEKIDLETAQEDIDEWRKEGIELPADITAKAYMNIWNELIEGEN